MVAARASLPAGLALDSHKRAEFVVPIIDLPLPHRVVLALDQGSGREAVPVVKQGDTVTRGELIARADDAFAANVHASIAGRVIAIDSREAPTAGGSCICITIERDDSPAIEQGSSEGLGMRRSPELDWMHLEPAELIDSLRAAGIAGLGGAGFPTATKLAAGRAKSVQTLVLNGAECEPWISSDDALMQTAGDEILLGAGVLQRACGAGACIVVIEDDKPAAIAAMTGAIERLHDAAITLTVVPAVYPRGAERQLISAVTGIEVPSGALPVDAGVVCQNVATAHAVARWVKHGEPLLTRVVTVTGSGVGRPCNVRAPVGTPLAKLIAAAAGYVGTPLRLIAGGNMTGRALPSDELGLTKAMNCVFVATRDDIATRIDAFELPCIRCGDCADVCPAGLLPQQLHRAALADQHDTLLQLGVRDCIDCGLCDFVCPSQIPLAQRFREARSRLAGAEAAASTAAAARDRHELHEQRVREAAAEEARMFEDVRTRARQIDGASERGTRAADDRDDADTGGRA